MIKNEIRRYYRDKKLLFAHWDAENMQKLDTQQNWLAPLRELFGKVVTFSPQKNYFNYGRERMNSMLLETVRKEMPDYIFFLVIYDEFDPAIFYDIKKINPKIKIVHTLSDDSWRYEDFGRYYAQFSDYVISAYHKTVPLHIKAGIRDIWFFSGLNTHFLKPEKTEKKYDVVFIGSSDEEERREYLSFLIKNGIKVDIWGRNWQKFPEFKECYHGPLPSDKWTRTVNQSKISLAFSTGGGSKPQIKGRPFELSACKAFMLVGYFNEYLDFFKANKEIIMFKNKQELLEKVKYYLKHEKEREKIAQSAYSRVIKDHNVDSIFNQILGKIMEDEKKGIIKQLPQFNYNIISLSEKDFDNVKNLKIKIQNYDYISFQKGKKHELKDSMQAFSLESSKKQISCCDYYAYSRTLGNYLLFKASLAFKKLPKQEFEKSLDISQITVRKDFFLKNLPKFRGFFRKSGFNLITEENTVFVSIPLVQIEKISRIDYKWMNEAFQMLFLNKLYSLHYQNKIFSLYPLMLSVKAITQRYIIKSLIDAITNKSKMYRLKKGF